ncbi:unnamed protein product [Calicophoron daubneyi]|uniref:Chromodomain-helicase-DNA-binding protein 1-like n=1 Tax=Calicophoron daubneyi TaxID=300641 RepID=A0AAV2TPA6_CALDB
MGIRNIHLRDYQLVGTTWLNSCYLQNRGGILCDEMGLGKTCQVITFINTVLYRSPKTSVLIVAPLSVLNNWGAEMTNFAPGINFLLYIGDKEARSIKRNSYAVQPCPVLLTSYEMCISDEEFLKNVHWDILVVDEGHRLKNSESVLYSILTETCRKVRFILTGTPVQNNLTELYNLLHFVSPKFFKSHSRSKFLTYFGEDGVEQRDAMTKLLRPFLLRRTKNQVLHDLPPRLDLIIYHSLTALQKRLYRALLTRNADVFLDAIEDGVKKGAPSYRINNLLMQLRKCVDHPYLFDGVEPEPFQLGQHLIDASGKLALLDSLLDYLYDPFSSKRQPTDSENIVSTPVHKVLIFSQMTRMLDIIQDYLTLKGYQYERLDGSVRGEDRFAAVDDFNQRLDSFIFLLSTKAGGQGLNLVAADTVILVDSDFNPQNDIQAASRAHRIGQTKPVRIIRLVSRNTVEEAILARADKKLKLTARVLQSADTKVNLDDEDAPTTVELTNVLKFGLASLMEEMNLEDGKGEENNGCNSGVGMPPPPKDLDFANILGQTDASTGHWIPPKLSDQPSDKTPGWVQLTDKPYECKLTEEDQKAVSKLKEAIVAEKEQSTTTEEGLHTRSCSQLAAKVPRKQLTPEEIAERKKKAAEALEARKQKASEAAALRAMKALEKRKALWESSGYQSLNVYRDEAAKEEEDESTADAQDWLNKSLQEEEQPEETAESRIRPDIYYKVGDASKPLTSFVDHTSGSSSSSSLPYDTPAFVCISVDDNGTWGRGGFFDAINRRTSEPNKAYELAGNMDDLSLGDCHLVPITASGKNQLDIRTFGDFLLLRDSPPFNGSINFCGLLVAQKRTRRSRSAGGPPEMQLHALERSLRALGMACRQLKHCSVHIPRLGYGTHAFTWYTVERLLRKHIVDRGHVAVYVYYYRHTKTPPSSPPAQQPTKAAEKTTSPKFSSRHLVNLFTDKVFYFWTGDSDTGSSQSLSDVEANQLKRLIITYDGDIATDINPRITHVLCLSRESPKPGLFQVAEPCHYITSSWVNDCIRSRRCLPETDYLPANGFSANMDQTEK